MKADKVRLDRLLVDRGLAPSRERAQSLILSGNVIVDDRPVTSAGAQIRSHAEIRIRGEDHPYVSRGGVKLRRALDEFGISASDRVALDVGASTGGFTDVLLKGGAKKVYALDVGTNQLDWSIRSDPRVVSIEGVNARNVPFDVIGETVGLIVVDLSFISLGKVVPNLIQFSTHETDWITLIKPQFEVGPERVGKGGIVTDESARQACINEVQKNLDNLGLIRIGLIESPITGTKGNREYLAHWKQKKLDKETK